MAAKFNFTEIQKAADEKFSDFEVIIPAEEGGEETVILRHLLRQAHEVRLVFKAALDPETYKGNKKVEELDTVDGISFLYREALRKVAADPEAFDRLEAVIREANEGRDDLAVWQELFLEYSVHTQLGEV